MTASLNFLVSFSPRASWKLELWRWFGERFSSFLVALNCNAYGTSLLILRRPVVCGCGLAWVGLAPPTQTWEPPNQMAFWWIIHWIAAKRYPSGSILVSLTLPALWLVKWMMVHSGMQISWPVVVLLMFHKIRGQVFRKGLGGSTSFSLHPPTLCFLPFASGTIG